MNDSPASILYDAAGTTLNVSDGATIVGSQPGLVIFGLDTASNVTRALHMNPNGAQYITGASSGIATATWNSSTPLNSVLTIGPSFDYTNVTVQFNYSGTITSGQATFQVSMDGVNWVPIDFASVAHGGVQSTVFFSGQTSPSGWQMYTAGFTYMQIILASVISGSGSVTVMMVATTIGVEPAVSVDAPGGIGVFGTGVAGTPNAGVVSVQGISGGTPIPLIGSVGNNTPTSTNNVPVMPAIANASAPTWTAGNQVALSVDLAGNTRVIAVQSSAAAFNATVIGNLTTNSSAPTNNNVGALVAIANAANPTYTEGRQVLLSTDLTGALRVAATISGSGTGTSSLFNSPFPTAGTAAGAYIVTGTPSYTAGTMQGLTMSTAGRLIVDGSQVTQPISGSVSISGIPYVNQNTDPWRTSDYSTGSPGFAIPTKTILAGGSDGTNLRSFRSFSMGSTEYVQGVNLRISGGSGSIEAKGAQTSANSIPVVVASDNTVTVTGAYTPTDGYNPVNAVQAWSYNAVWNGGSWDRLKGTSGALWTIGTLTNNNAAPSTNNVGALTVRANASPPSWTEGNLVTLSADLSGNLRTIGSLSNNASAPTSSMIGAMVAYAVTSPPSYTNGDMVLLTTDTSGRLNVNATVSGGSGTSSSFGSAFPGAGTAAGFLDSTGSLMASAQVDANHYLKVNISASAINVPVVGTYSNNTSAPGSNLEATLVAVATTANPSYTNGNLVALSTDLTGALRVNATISGGAGGTASSFGAAFPATGTAIGVKDSSGANMTNMRANALNDLVTSTDINTSTGTIVNSGDTVSMAMQGRAGAAVKVVTAATSGAIAVVYEASYDNGVTWYLTMVMDPTMTNTNPPANLYGKTMVQDSFANNTTYQRTYWLLPGTTNIRIRATNTVTNAATITIVGSNVTAPIQIVGMMGWDDQQQVGSFYRVTAPVTYTLGTSGTGVVIAGVASSAGQATWMTLDANNALTVGGAVNNNQPFTKQLTVGAGAYNATLPTYTNGNVGMLQMDVNGRLITVPGLASLDTINSASLTPTSGTTGYLSTALNGATNVAFYGVSGGSASVIWYPQISFDGGTTWEATYFIFPSASTSVITYSPDLFQTWQWSGGAPSNPTNSSYGANVYIPPGASHVRVYANSAGSGTSTFAFRVSNGGPVNHIIQGPARTGSANGNYINPIIIGGLYGSNVEAIQTNSAGNLIVVGPNTTDGYYGTNFLMVGGSNASGTATTLKFDINNMLNNGTSTNGNVASASAFTMTPDYLGLNASNYSIAGASQGPAVGTSPRSYNSWYGGKYGWFFYILGGGTLVATLTPQWTYDGTNFYSTGCFFVNPTTGVRTATLAVSSPATQIWGIQFPSGASGYRVVATTYSSGSSTVSLVASREATWRPVTSSAEGAPGSAAPSSAMLVGGSDGTNLRPINTDSSGNVKNVLVATATGGGATNYTPYVATATTNATNVKGSAGQLFSITGFCVAAYPVYVKFFDKATAPVPGTDTPVYVFPLPASTVTGNVNISFNVPISFVNGVGFAITKGIANSDATAVAAGDCIISFQYA